jgi:3-hydroxyisobutyrate dehydrogenase-like beta-hydroxyacid dehydrogenase
MPTKRKQPLPTVGILYAGEMGSALGRLLGAGGLRVVTTLAGRGPRTRRLCREAGLEVLPSLAEVVRQAKVVVSLVPPSAALAVAEQVAAAAREPGPGRLYVDANAVSPETATAIGAVLAAAPVAYVDAAIHGLASQLACGAMLYLSGSRAAEVAGLLGRWLPVQVVGDRPGQASALKGLLAGMSKGLSALFAEVAVLARASGLSESFLERCRAYYPGLMEVIDRMLPTYPRHAGRRVEELREIEQTQRALGLEPLMVRAARQVTEAMAEADLDEPAALPWTTERVVEELHDRARGGLKCPRGVLSHRRWRSGFLPSPPYSGERGWG